MFREMAFGVTRVTPAAADPLRTPVSSIMQPKSGRSASYS